MGANNAENNGNNKNIIDNTVDFVAKALGGGDEQNDKKKDHQLHHQDHDPSNSEEKGQSKNLGEKVQDAMPNSAADASRQLDEATTAAQKKIQEGIETGKKAIQGNGNEGGNQDNKDESKSSQKNIGEKVQDALPENAADAGKQIDTAVQNTKETIQNKVEDGKKFISKAESQEEKDRKDISSDRGKNLGEKIQDALPKDAQEAGEKLDEIAVVTQNKVQQGIELFQNKINDITDNNDQDKKNETDQGSFEEKKIEESK